MKEFGTARAALRPILDTAQATDPCGEIPSEDGKVRAWRKETTLFINKRDFFPLSLPGTLLFWCMTKNRKNKA